MVLYNLDCFEYFNKHIEEKKERVDCVIVDLPYGITDCEWDVKIDLVEMWRQLKKIHPTQKPVALLEWLVMTYSNEGDTILDFTMGSGSTGVACINTKRNFIGVEKDPAIFKVAQERIEKIAQVSS